MNASKSLLTRLGETFDEYRADRRRGYAQNARPQPSRPRRFLRWLMPNGGTLLLVAVLIATAQVWAKPLTTPINAPGPSATTVNYQGRLANPDGSPVMDGNYGMDFALYATDTGGSPLWTESHTAVPVSEGLFSVALGIKTGGGIPTTMWDGDRYLEITVAGETLSPRELIRSVPIAGMALTVPDGAIGTTQVADSAITEEKLAPGAVSTLNILRQDDTTNSQDDRAIVTGWGYIQGNDTPGLTEHVDFGFTFAEPPIVLASFLGASGGIQPTSIGDFSGIDVGAQKVWTVAPADITTSGFEVEISRNTANFGSANFYGYTWIAIASAP